MTTDSFDEHISSLTTLGEPVRRALYRYVASELEPVSREQATHSVGLPWHVARFHLANSPSRALGEEFLELACGMNLELLRGILEGLHPAGFEARLDRAFGRCCVTVSTA